jgi:hypothetical protein
MTAICPQHCAYSLMRTFAAFEKTAAKQADLLEQQAKQDFLAIDQLRADKLAKLPNLSQSIASEKTWSMIRGFASVSSLALGAFSLRKEETKTAGIFLLAATVTNAVSHLFTQTGVVHRFASWMTSSEDGQQAISAKLNTGMQWLSAGLNLAGTILSYQAGTLPKIGSDIYGTLGGIGLQAIDLKQAFIKKQTHDSSALLQQIESYIMQISYRLNDAGKESAKLLKSVGNICEAVKNAIQTLHPRN